MTPETNYSPLISNVKISPGLLSTKISKGRQQTSQSVTKRWEETLVSISKGKASPQKGHWIVWLTSIFYFSPNDHKTRVREKPISNVTFQYAWCLEIYMKIYSWFTLTTAILALHTFPLIAQEEEGGEENAPAKSEEKAEKKADKAEAKAESAPKSKVTMPWEATKFGANTLAKYDANKNGTMDPEEKETMKAAITKKIDKNGDGVLDESEIEAWQKAKAANSSDKKKK
jgi:hypothetical protein